MNDNGYYDDHEGKLAVMDIFGIDAASEVQTAKFNHALNRDVSKPEELKKLCSKVTQDIERIKI